MSADQTRIAIASDQAIYLRGLQALVLSIPGSQLVGVARSAAEALQLCQLTGPDVLILDLEGARERGHGVSAQLGQACGTTRIILMTVPGEETRGLENPVTRRVYAMSRSINEEDFKSAFNRILADGAAGEEPSPLAFASAAVPEEEMPVAGEMPGKPRARPVEQRSQETLTRELVMAGRIQTSILPEYIPSIPGWDIAARLESARETSGDFYDFIPLTDHKWGVVVADVTDKGIGAALFMVLSSTLIRTYTSRFPTLPALALNTVSERILSDTGGSMFVTALFGILEPQTGRFIYANAGHPPGFLISNQRGRESIEPLRPTGMALGVIDQAAWKQKVVRVGPGDILLLYTDGVIEAENPRGEFFGEERLLDVILARTDRTAGEIEEAILEAVHQFVGGAPQQDDIALIIIRRDR